MQFTNLDVLVLSAVAFSGAVGLFRGFTREILDLVAILTAAGLAFLAISYEPMVSLVRTAMEFKEPMAAQGMLGAVVFIVAAGSIFSASRKTAKVIHEDGPQSLDRAMGLVFGASRGFLLVVIYLLVNATGYQTMSVRPGGWRLKQDCYTYPFVKWAGDGVMAVVLPYLPDDIAQPASRVRL